MKKMIKTEETHLFTTPRMRGVRVSYADEEGNNVLTHTIIRSNPTVAMIVRWGSKIALLTQFRSTTGRYYIELPAGMLEEGETEVEAAVREVREETGLLVKNAYSLVRGPSLLDMSKSDENFGITVGEVSGETSRDLDEMEVIDSKIIWMEEAEILERLKGQMFEGKPFMNGLFMTGPSLYGLMALAIKEHKI